VRMLTGVIAAMFLPGIWCVNSAAAGDQSSLAEYYGFGQIEIVKLNYGISNLKVADFNADGRNDIAAVNNPKARIELLIQKQALGPAEEEVTVDPQDIDINAIKALTRYRPEPVAVSQEIFSLACGDLNSDGLTDLAFYGRPAGLYVILQKATTKADATTPGKLSWQSRKKLNITDGVQRAHSLVCADLNNDGADDLALAGRDGIYVILQRTDGTLAEPVKYATTAQTLGIRAADLNGDEINDLILITNDKEKRIHVRFGLVTGQLGPQMKFFVEKPYWLKLHNIDELAGDEMLMVDSVSGRLICYKLVAREDKDVDWPILYYPLPSGAASSNRRDLVVADLNGDGLAEVVISEPESAEIIVYMQKANVGLTEPVRFGAFAEIESMSAADIDGDGRAELCMLSVKEKIIGISRFYQERLSFPRPIETIGEPVAMAVDDVDNDGWLDCLYISKDSNDSRILTVAYNLAASSVEVGPVQNIPMPPKPDRTGGNETVRKPTLVLDKLNTNPDGMKVLDVDQDGLKDVLIFVPYEQPILVRQTQTGKFEVVESPAAQASLIKEATLHSIATADVDGRAGKELLIGQRNFARSLVFAGGKTWTVIDQYNAKSTENNISAVAAFAIEQAEPGARPAILLLDGQKGQLQILTAGEDKTYRFEKQLDVGSWNMARNLKLLYAPLTGGDAKSILVFDSEKFALITGPSDDGGVQHLEQQFSYETKIKDGEYGNLAAGDINSDGWAEVIMADYRHNHIEILALDGENKPVPAMRFKIFEEKSYRNAKRKDKSAVEPRQMTIADVTADDKNDLVTLIHDRIIVYPQD